MLSKRLSLAFLLVGLGTWVLASGSLGVSTSLAHGAGSQAMSSSSEAEVPPYHPAAAPRKDLPATLDPMKFPDPITENAYAMAARAKAVLYQQPCYCHCDREYGHSSLLDCFTGTHAAVCNICKAEAIYAYTQHLNKKSAAQIRAGILKGDWNKVDLTQFRQYKFSTDSK